MIEDVIILRGAEEDFLAAFIYFDDRGKGTEFYQEVDEKLAQLKKFPKSGNICHGDFRRLLLKPRFSYGIYYRIYGVRLVVSAILYLKIYPNKILERLKM